jgi:hypothetical protein
MSTEMSRLDSRRGRTATSNKDYRARLTEVSHLEDRAPVSSAIWGGPVVRRALMLPRSSCDVRSLPASSLSEAESFREVRLLLLAPTPGSRAKRREPTWDRCGRGVPERARPGAGRLVRGTSVLGRKVAWRPGHAASRCSSGASRPRCSPTPGQNILYIDRRLRVGGGM